MSKMCSRRIFRFVIYYMYSLIRLVFDLSKIKNCLIFHLFFVHKKDRSFHNELIIKKCNFIAFNDIQKKAYNLLIESLLFWFLIFSFCIFFNRTKQQKNYIIISLKFIANRMNISLNAFDCFCFCWIEVIKNRRKKEQKISVEWLSLTIKCHFVKCMRVWNFHSNWNWLIACP